MKGKRIGLSGLLVVLAVTFFLTSAHAQIPDLSIWENTWFRVNTRQSGQAFEDGRMFRENMRGVFYLEILTQEGRDLNVRFYLQEGGVWQVVPGVIFIIGGTESDFLCYTDLRDDENGAWMYTGLVARAQARMMRGELRPNSIKSLGGFYMEEENGFAAAGSISINGSFISEPPPGVIVPINGSSM